MIHFNLNAETPVQMSAKEVSVVYNGENGKSAYEIALENGFEGTEAEWLDSLQGPAGPAGPAGAPGDDYILTEADKQEIAEQAAGLVEIPAGGGFVVSDTAPTDTSILWVDPNDDSDDGYQEAVNDALAQAKAGGEFNGPKGDTGVGITTVRQTTTSSADGGTNVVTMTLSNGTTSTFTVRNGGKGSTGATGPKGDTGATGPEGPQGDKGDKGDKGDTGATGPAGANGKDGQDGSPGKDGADGVSATHSWNGTVLTVTSASGTSSADLKGAKGDKGDKGDTGSKGDKGDTGATGPKGDTGATGPTGPAGYTPVKGTDYWTPADKTEMVNAVIAALPVYNGEVV